MNIRSTNDNSDECKNVRVKRHTSKRRVRKDLYKATYTRSGIFRTHETSRTFGREPYNIYHFHNRLPNRAPHCILLYLNSLYHQDILDSSEEENPRTQLSVNLIIQNPEI
jgi:hypothetical protein